MTYLIPTTSDVQGCPHTFDNVVDYKKALAMRNEHLCSLSVCNCYIHYYCCPQKERTPCCFKGTYSTWHCFPFNVSTSCSLYGPPPYPRGPSTTAAPPALSVFMPLTQTRPHTNIRGGTEVSHNSINHSFHFHVGYNCLILH